ncbi:MAG: hypothetical protein ACOYN2_01465 [Patescibacteria group bacterium]
MLLQNRVTKATALSNLRTKGLIPKDLPDSDPLTKVILLENYDAVTGENGSTIGWTEHLVPFVLTPGEVAVRAHYVRVRSRIVGFNLALKIIKKCCKAVGIHLDFYKLYNSHRGSDWKNKLINTFFERGENGEFQVLPTFPLRFKTSLLTGIPYKVVSPA